MNSIKQAPLVKIILSFLAGIIIGFYFYVGTEKLLLAGTVFFVLSLFFIRLFKTTNNYSFRWIHGLVIHLSIFLIAWMLALLNTENRNRDHFSSIHHGKVFLAVVSEDPKDKGKSLRFETKVISMEDDSGWHPCTGRCLVYLRNDSSGYRPEYGDLLAIASCPVDVPASPNPGQFDFKQWLAYRQVYQQAFLRGDQCKILAHDDGNKVVRLAVESRKKLLRVFQEAGLGGQEYAVLSALILGYEDEILPETMQAYAAAGALHILSVSGMHVGLIYGVLMLLLKWMDKIKRGKILRAVFILLFLWFYSLLTGFSPSVLRSAMMLSFVVIGKTMERSSNMYNTLAASALALFAVFSPFLARQVGFQLSYLAVAGIVFLYPPIHRLFYFNTWLVRQAWSIVAVSMAAQLATGPLSLFYFHQFPNYFLAANLVVIPLSTLVIFSGLALFPFAAFPLVIKKLGWVVSREVACLNGSVRFCEELPHSLAQHILVTFSGMIILYVLLLCIALFFIERRRAYVFPALICLNIYTAFRIILIHHQSEQEACTVFDIPGHTCIRLLEGSSSILLADSGLNNNPRQLESATGGHRIMCGIKEEKKLVISGDALPGGFYQSGNLLASHGLIQFGKLKMLIIGPEFHPPEKKSEMKIDCLIIYGNPRWKMDSLLGKISFAKLIADGSNSQYKIKQWKESAVEHGIPFYATREQGAWSWRDRD